MEFAIGARTQLSVYCQGACRSGREVDLLKLSAGGRAKTPIADLRFKCAHCGAAGTPIVNWWEGGYSSWDYDRKVLSGSLPGTFAAAVKRELPTTNALIHHGGRPLAGRICTGFEGCIRDAGLPPEVTPHWLRHTAATWLMQNGVDPWEAAGYLGMNLKTLIDNYGHHQPDHQAGARRGIGGEAVTDNEEAIWVNHEALRSNRVSLAALGTAMSLVFEVWWPTKKGFQWEPEQLATLITAPDVTPQGLEELRDEVATFFTILDDGRWVPSPIYFSMVDGNPGHLN